MRLIAEDLRQSLSATDAFIPAVASQLGNPSWEQSPSRILILRLSPFVDVEGSTSHLVLFAECRSAMPGAYIDFGFFPDRRDREILVSHNAPLFYGIASGRAPEDFDLVLVSNSFALELPNISYLFGQSGIPSRASARAAAAESGARIPIIVLGGSNSACAGSLLLPDATGAAEGAGASAEASDCLVDAIFFGEGESALGDIARLGSAPGRSRLERLDALGDIEGLWLAQSGRGARRRCEMPYPHALVAYPVLNSSGASTAKLQISAGCPGYCSFCLEGWESRPYRELPVEEILRAARELKAASGASGIEIYSYNFNTHAGVFELIFELHRLFRRVNFMSQRIDILAASPELAAAEVAADKRSFTLGIEGISERMRSFYRKGVTLGDIEAAAANLCRPAARELKLFYIISGLEDDEDVTEFSAFLASLVELKRRRAPGLRILASAGYLVRLPFTPLQFAPLCLDREHLEAIAAKLEAACEDAGVEFRLAASYEEYYVDQVLALGGSALGPWIEGAAEAGIVYDGSLSRGAGRSLEAFANEAGLLDEVFLAEKSATWRPPLAFSDENHKALRKQYELASCFAQRAGKLPVPAASGPEAMRRLERLMAAKRKFAAVFVRVSFPEEFARATEEFRSSYLQRRIFAAASEAVPALFDAEEELFAKGARLEGFAERYWGEACYRLLGPNAEKLAAAARAAGLEVLEASPEPERIEAELELPAAYAAEAAAAIKAWLGEERVSFVETKSGAARELACAKADEKKKSLYRAVIETRGARFCVSLELGHKARLEPLLAKLGREERRAASLRVVSWS
jgi:Fe-S oxidoreductase